MQPGQQRRAPGRVLAVVAIAALLLGGLWLLIRPQEDGGGTGVQAPLALEVQTPGSASMVATPPSNAAVAQRLFDEACAWVANGEAPIAHVRDLTWAMDAKLDIGRARHEGLMLVWLESPDLFRVEQALGSEISTRILKRGELHRRMGSGPFAHMNPMADGAAAIQQTQDEMDRVGKLATFVTLEGLKGPGVTFEYEGEKKSGTWSKIVRRLPGHPNIYLWLAHVEDARGVKHATYPGVVRVDGDLGVDSPTEDFLLQDWRETTPSRPRSRRAPTKIQAFQIRPGQPTLNFLTAFMTDFKINTGIDPTRFDPK